MKLGEKFKKMTDSERRKYAAKKLHEYEKKFEFWKRISQKLSRDEKLTLMEEDLIDTILEKANI
jgi:hypothetical protein